MSKKIFSINQANLSSQQLTGSTALDDYIQFIPTGQLLEGNLLQVANGLHLIVLDLVTSKSVTITLPSLESPNAIEYFERQDSGVYTGMYRIVAPSDASTSAEDRLDFYGTSGNDRSKGQGAINGFSVMSGGAGDDHLTGAAGGSILSGGSGQNTLIGRSPLDVFRASVKDGGIDKIYSNGQGTIDDLQIIVPSSSLSYFNFEQIGSDLVGIVTGEDGSTYQFTVVDHFAGQPISKIGIGFYGASDFQIYWEMISDGTWQSQMFPLTDRSETLDLRPIKKQYVDVFGNDGDDIVIAKDGMYTAFFGGDGVDKIIYSKVMRNYSVETNFLTGRATIKGAGGILDDVLYAERIEFSDSNLALDFYGSAGKAYRVYKAAFDRDPVQGDRVGLGYWIAQMDKGMSLTEAAARFVDSNEFRTLYGTDPTNAQFLSKLYQNVLGRAPEATGYNWWLNELNTNPSKTKAKVLADFAESSENQAGVASLVGNGITYEPWVG
jgi:hypothetical protein